MLNPLLKLVIEKQKLKLVNDDEETNPEMGKDRDLINIKVCNYCDIIQNSNYAFTKRYTHCYN